MLDAPKPDVLSSLVRAVGAGLIVWGIVNQWHPVFTVPVEYHHTELNPPPEKVAAYNFQETLADQKNATLFTACLGGLLAAAMALGPSVGCPSWLRFLIGLVWGAIVGAAAGFAGAKADSAIPGTAVLDTIKVQALVFAVLGAGIGLLRGAFARSIQTGAKGAGAGALAGALAGMAYPVIVAMLMPSAAMHRQIPEETPVQLVWIGSLVICVATIIPLIMTPQTRATPVEKAG